MAIHGSVLGRDGAPGPDEKRQAIKLSPGRGDNRVRQEDKKVERIPAKKEPSFREKKEKQNPRRCEHTAKVVIL